MSGPSEAEQVALVQSGPLLRYAAEQVKNLDPSLVLAVASARQAIEDGGWTPQVSQEFWAAFNQLCQLIQPATMDSIAAQHADLPTWSLIAPRKRMISLARRSSGRYLVVLFVLIAFAVPLQLYSWLYSIESRRVDDLISAIQNTGDKIALSYTTLEGETHDLPGPKWTSAEVSAARDITNSAANWNESLERLTYYVIALERLSFRSASGTRAAAAQLQEMQWYDAFRAVSARSQTTVLAALDFEATAGLIAGVILSFVLPIMFGMIGAVAFAIRTISDQIKATTFSTTSPIRHIMRVTLGALAGVVVGLFSNLSTQISLPPLAIAFLAGYGIEALFSMFDGFIARFRAP